MARPTKRTVLASLGKKRLIELDRAFEIGTSQAEPKDAFIEALASSKRASFQNVLESLPLAELKRICLAHELAVSGTKAQLADRIRGVDAEGAEASEAEVQLGLDLDDFIKRSQPTVAAIVPMLFWAADAFTYFAGGLCRKDLGRTLVADPERMHTLLRPHIADLDFVSPKFLLRPGVVCKPPLSAVQR